MLRRHLVRVRVSFSVSVRVSVSVSVSVSVRVWGLGRRHQRWKLLVEVRDGIGRAVCGEIDR